MRRPSPIRRDVKRLTGPLKHWISGPAMSSNSPRKDPAGPHWLLRRADQLGVAVLVLAGLAATGGWWISHGGWSGRLVELERAEPRTADFQLDLNTAEWPELVQLPGIGEVLARRIVDDRSRHGPFVDQEDLMRVRGIGPKTLDGVRPYLRPMPSQEALAGQ